MARLRPEDERSATALHDVSNGSLYRSLLRACARVAPLSTYPKRSGDPKKHGRPKHAHPDHRPVRPYGELLCGKGPKEGKRHPECEDILKELAVNAHRIPCGVGRRLPKNPEVIDPNEVKTHRHEEEGKAVDECDTHQKQNQEGDPIERPGSDPCQDKADSGHDHSREDRPELIEVEPTGRDPKLGVDRLRHDEIERALSHLLRDFNQRKEEGLAKRSSHVYNSGENRRLPGRPTGDIVGVAVQHHQHQREEEHPRCGHEELRDEIGTELEFAPESAPKEAPVDPQIPLHTENGGYPPIMEGTMRLSAHPLERIGLLGLLGFGLWGWASFVLMWTARTVSPAMAAIGLVVAGAATWGLSRRIQATPVEANKAALPIAGLFGIALLFPLVRSLTPSDMGDWDTLAYHFAVPKLWIEAGQITYIPFIHQSNFPFLVDTLFLNGLFLGEVAAKLINTLMFAVGLAWLFGATRRYATLTVAGITTLGYALTPLVLWSSGSGYIDVIHGLYSAVAALTLFELLSEPQAERWLIFGLALGMSMGSKYTGLQVATALLPILFFVFLRTKVHWRAVGLGAALCLLVASPWYIRNIQNTGNPVYPFFFGALGGRGWDEFRAEIYKDEQQTFGVGRTAAGRDPLTIGHAILGLAYQPGRYINPGQTAGMGFPMGSLGPVLLLGLLAAIVFGIRHPVVRGTSLMAGVLALFWFFLSQQVRYFTGILPLAALSLAILLERRPKSMPWAGVLVGAQGVFTVWLLNETQLRPQLSVLLGQVDRDAYQVAAVPFAGFARTMNDRSDVVKVALYDEVFGYFLNKPYVWANPGHSTLLGYEQMSNGNDLAAMFRREEFSHVYLALSLPGSPYRADLASALFSRQPLPEEQAEALGRDLRTRWIPWLAEAVAAGELEVDSTFGRQERPTSVLLRVVRR